MKKHIANIITASRILFSVILLFLPVLGAGFYTTYLLCGITDMIDGTIARKTGAVSKFGAKLDTVMNKITGFLLFLLPLTFPVIDLNDSSIAVCVIASLAAIQESFYIVKGENYDSI